MMITRKTIFVLLFTTGFYFLYASQLIAQEESSSFWGKFFSSTTSSDDSAEDDLPFGIDKDSVTNEPLAEGEDSVKPKRVDPKILSKDIVEATSKDPFIKNLYMEKNIR